MGALLGSGMGSILSTYKYSPLNARNIINSNKDRALLKKHIKNLGITIDNLRD